MNKLLISGLLLLLFNLPVLAQSKSVKSVSASSFSKFHQKLDAHERRQKGLKQFFQKPRSKSRSNYKRHGNHRSRNMEMPPVPKARPGQRNRKLSAHKTRTQRLKSVWLKQNQV